jgi:hypothetical protein
MKNPIITKLKANETVSFQEVMAYIDAEYHFIPTAFKNGNQVNAIGENNGSCKLFSFAKMHQLSKVETLLLFGDYYKDVLATPNETDHQNIRNFMEFGWDGIAFESDALTEKR